METRFARFVREFQGRLAMPLAAFAGLEITGESVEDMVSMPGAQFKAVMALQDRYLTPVLITAIDPTAEAETYGCEVRMEPRAVPKIVGRLVTSAAEIADLPDPVPGDARTRVPLETAWRLVAEGGENVPVLGTMLGPFSLAGGLFGEDEIIAAAAAEPETIEALLDNLTGFLCRYALEFRETGSWGVIVIEPATGRLSPSGLGRFSAPFVKRIVKAVETSDFAILLHSGSATIGHLEEVRTSGSGILHFGPSMDIVAALGRVDADVIVSGNLDPASFFQKGTPQATGEATRALLEATRTSKNFVISSGGPIPPGSPLANLNAFFKAVADHNRQEGINT